MWAQSASLKRLPLPPAVVITHCGLENFKGFRKLDIDLRSVNVFIGPNGSGKSSVGQSLLLLKQSPGGGMNLGGPYLRANDFRDIQRIGSESNLVQIALIGSIETRELGVSKDFMEEVARFEAEFAFERGQVRRSRTEIRVKGTTLAAQWDRYEGTKPNTLNFQNVQVAYQGTQEVGLTMQVVSTSTIA